MFRDPTLFLLDIFVAIKKIEIYTHPFDNADTFCHSMAEWDATIRQFEIIGEAMNSLIKNGIFDEEKR